MKKIIRFLRSRRSSGEAGQALIVVMIFLIMGSLTLVPTLIHISTALKTGEVYEKNTDELYTADSGIEDSLWRIKYDFLGADYNPYDFNTSWPYQTEDINGMPADFTISNVWFPTDVTLDQLGLDANEAKAMMESEKLVVAGSALPGNPYRVLASFIPDVGDNLTIKSIGVWMPRGFNYNGGCSLQVQGQEYNPDHVVGPSPAPGGTTILFKYDAPYPLFTQFPNFDAGTMSFNFTFNYTEDNPNLSPVAWITTGMNGPNADDVPVSWDIDTRYYKMVSTAGDTVIDAYSSKNELRQMGDAMSGDYVAIGNALLLNNPADRCRDIWSTPSSSTLNSVPADADAVYAYLYWSGWRNQNAVGNVFSDSCSDFTNWVRSSDVIINQTRYPTGDISKSGTWDKTTNMYTYVDEQGTNDGDTTYLKHGTTAGYALFSFSPVFSVPAGSVIQDLTVYLVAKDDSSGTNKMQPALRVGGTNYTDTNNPSVSTEVPTSYGTISYAYTYNPKRGTGNAWTTDDINGIGSYALQGFGVYSADASPAIRLTQVYAKVDYYTPSLWSISSNRFQGQGSTSTNTAPRTITLKNSLNLSAAGIYNISWTQTESGNLLDTDTLYYAFSGDGGNNWSGNYEAFSDDNPTSPFSINIPSTYATANFKMRFYFNFNSTSKYVYLDDIKIVYLPVDTDVIFKINDQQVYLNGYDPATGPNKVTAGRSYAMLNYLSGPCGFSYSCVRDVSALVKTYPIVPGEEHHTGNAKYTVGDVTADTKNGGSSCEIAFAAWSLIIVYACPETAGHYIYIRDNNFYSHTSGDTSPLDFDQDGIPGGKITNFKVPDPIKDKYGHIVETVAAKLTCFVVEGDSWYTGDYLEITGQQSGLSKNLSNPQSPVDNVWNDKSYPGTVADGVDIDTFEIEWSDGVLTPRDTDLQVDLVSDTDAWNLVYFIISIRSETQTGGTSSYLIHGT